MREKKQSSKKPREIERAISKTLHKRPRFKSPPPKLAALIELANGFPSDVKQLRSMSPQALEAEANDVQDRAVLLATNMGADTTSSRSKDLVNGNMGKAVSRKERAELAMKPLRDVIEEKIDPSSAKLREYVLFGIREDIAPLDTGRSKFMEAGMMSRYRQIWDATIKLRGIARAVDVRVKTGRWATPFFGFNDSYTPPPLMEVGKDGILYEFKSLFSEVIASEKIEVVRVRVCEVCKRIFWAGRITMKGCSARCGDVLRKRRLRERYRQGFYQGAKLSPKEQREAEAKRAAATKKGK